MLPRHDIYTYGTRDLAGIIGVAAHHSATAQDVTAEQIAQYHVDGHNWPAIGYTLCLEANRLVRCHPPETLCYGVASRNHELYSICVVGDFRPGHDTPTDFQRRAWPVALQVALHDVGKDALTVLGHSAWAVASSPTACPGALVAELAVAGYAAALERAEGYRAG